MDPAEVTPSSKGCRRSPLLGTLQGLPQGATLEAQWLAEQDWAVGRKEGEGQVVIKAKRRRDHGEQNCSPHIFRHYPKTTEEGALTLEKPLVQV